MLSIGKHREGIVLIKQVQAGIEVEVDLISDYGNMREG